MGIYNPAGSSDVQNIQGIAGGVTVPISAPAAIPTLPGAPTAANIVTGFRADTVTTAAATILTVPQGRTWSGFVGINVNSGEVAGGAVQSDAEGIISVAGAGATPPAGSIVKARAAIAANAATGTVGNGGAANTGPVPLVVIAPAGNAVTIQAASTIAGTFGEVDFYAIGALQ